MKLTRCDNHPDRDAIATFRIIKLLHVGIRPILVGYSGGGYILDLCEGCANNIPKKGN